MSRRKTVKLKLDVIGGIIKAKCRSYTVFCERMERGNNWATDWFRKDSDGNPKPKNLPSPEEAARMCVILEVRPEDILAEPEDIALVQSLLDSQKAATDESERIPHTALREYLVGQGVRIMLDADAKVTEQTIVNTLKKLSELQEQNDK